jgi:hypothetical protein
MPIQNVRLLNDFVQYLDRQGRSQPFTLSTTMRWVCNESVEQSVSTQYARFFLARGFLIHLKASLLDTEIPSVHLIAKPRRTKPFVFSVEDFDRLIKSSNGASVFATGRKSG